MLKIFPNLNSYIHIRTYFRHLLRAVPVHNAQSKMTQCLMAFYESKNSTFKCCFGGLHLPVALNLLKYVLLNSARMPYLSKIFPSCIIQGLSQHFIAAAARNALFEKQNTLFSAKTFYCPFTGLFCTLKL